MRFIPSKFHGFLDYAVAVTLILGPILLGFEGVAKILAIAGGLGLFVYSMITDYSVSVRNLLPFSVHLIFDFVAALVLVAAPFIFGFEGLAKLFYLVIGVSVIAVVVLTNPETNEMVEAGEAG